MSYLLATIISSFGLLTLFLSGSVIFNLFGMREEEGNYILFIVQANFISSILYLFSAYGIFMNKAWTVKPLRISAILLIVSFAGLFMYINSGGLYEIKTIYAMIFRIGITLAFASMAMRLLKNKKP